MSSNATRRTRRGGPNTRAARGRRPRAAGDISVSRTEYIGPFPTSGGAFTSTTLSVYPGSPAISPISQLYTEYRFVRYVLRVVPRASTTTLGTVFVAFRGSPPSGAPTSLAAAATLNRFRTLGASHGNGMTVMADTRVALRPWLQYVVQPTAEQLLDPNYCQFWLVVGSDSVQSGVIPADLHVSYTVIFRSSADLPGATITENFSTSILLR